MGDISLHDVLRRFARTMAQPYDVTDALHELCDHIGAVLGAEGAGISLVDDDGRLRFVTATSTAVTAVERVQEQQQAGPCFAAYQSGTPTVVVDIGTRPEWPEYREVARDNGLTAMLGLSMTVGDDRLGALNVYDADVRDWTDDDVNTAAVLADVAAAYFINASELERSRRIASQLQEALDSRVLIEQAKGKLAGERSITPDAAFEVMRSYARSRNRKLRSVAEDVIERHLELD